MTYLSRRALFLLVVLSIAGLVLVYPPTRLLTLLIPGWRPEPWQLLALLGLPISIRLLHEQTHHAWSRALTAVVMTWLGVCFVMLSILLPAELVLLGGFVHAQTVGQWVAVIVLAISLYSIYNAHRLHVRVVDLSADSALQGLKLAQVSDVHIGSRQPGFLTPIVAKVNALEPDYTLITGDLIDMHGIAQDSLAALGELNSPTLFCIGNHERYVDTEDICSRLASLGIEVLRNASVRKNEFQFIGIDDAERKDQVEREIEKFSPALDAYRVLLYHRPDGAQAASDWGAHLMLTGHTHRGQIFPFNFLVKRFFPQIYQRYEFGNMTLYVSPGTGTWGPVMRLGSKCEITLFRLL
jgi:predicted MPP superfamily phosphohydrolase